MWYYLLDVVATVVGGAAATEVDLRVELVAVAEVRVELEAVERVSVEFRVVAVELMVLWITTSRVLVLLLLLLRLHSGGGSGWGEGVPVREPKRRRQGQ